MISDEERENIIKRYLAGEKSSHIAKDLGVNPSSISRMLKKYLNEANEIIDIKKQKAKSKESPKKQKAKSKIYNTARNGVIETIEEIDQAHKATIRQLSDELNQALSDRDFNTLKCVKIATEAFEKISSLERKWLKMDEKVANNENKFDGVTFKVIGGDGYHEADLPNQNEMDYKKYYVRANQ